jgi:hypothetical protein
MICLLTWGIFATRPLAISLLGPCCSEACYASSSRRPDTYSVETQLTHPGPN